MPDFVNGIWNGNVNPNYNANLTTSAGLAPSVQEYYNRHLLENIKPKLVHAQFGQQIAIGRNSGKTVSFRKWTPFPAITQPLVEAIVPDGQSLNMTSVQANLESYGGYVTLSDQVEMTLIDPIVSETVELMADQGALSVDHVVRRELHSQATNVQYAGDATALGAVAATDVLTMAEVRKAVRTLKKNKAKPFTRGGKTHFVAIVSPDTVYDLQNDEKWEKVSVYQDKENIYSGEIGRMYGVVFVESGEAMTYGGAAFVSEVTVASYAAGTKTVTLSRALNDDEADGLVAAGVVSINGNKLEVESARGKEIVLTGAVGTAPAAGNAVVAIGPGAANAPVASTLVFGQNAYGVVAMDNANVQSIVKPAGSAGTADPLNQASTVGWKINNFTAKLLEPGWLVQILHGITE